MITPAQEEQLIAHARTEVAGAVAACLLRAGHGVKVRGNVVSTEPGRDAAAPETVVIEERRAAELLVEQVHDRIYINAPPVHDVVPTLNGESIFAHPRPWLPVIDGSWGIWLKIAYTRTGVVIPPTGGSGTSLTAGLTVTGVAVTVEMHAAGSPPANVTPPDPGGDTLPPFAGNYVSYVQLGSLTDGVVLVNDFAFAHPSQIGGFRIATPGSFNDPGPWLFLNGAFVVP